MEPTYRFILDRIKSEYTFTIVDIGAMGGIAKKWNSLSGFVKIIAFEPDEREFNKLKSGGNVTYFNCALYDKSQDLRFYITKSRGKSSIYEPNITLLSQFEDVERYYIEKKETIPSEKVRTLDSIIEDNSITDVDFLKLDTQGSELNILKGGEKLTIPKVFGIQIEVEFIEMYKNQPLFWNVDEFMQRSGYQLVDLRRQYWKRKEYYDYVGKGQLVFGDALYLKRTDFLFQELHALHDKSYSTSKIYKIILACLIYRLFDYAVSVAKIGFELGYLSKSEYENILSEIVTRSNKGVIPNFLGKAMLYSITNLIGRKLKPKSYLGWADSDENIGNINDV